ncbi:hypothetical protein [Aquipseudomonas guryensis]|jgi:hypothetical protein|uniref:Uncharacterized protein n=1 Tax=Aquipseudomonas guryensis TaxID=2759165 RepID=A0A7W4DD03_9GAMM|nr:hypothetical protein [Pseudomonas guryensis]MBB1520352.1 hypothetical protein [Pseudomonas guryensis]
MAQVMAISQLLIRDLSFYAAIMRLNVSTAGKSVPQIHKRANLRVTIPQPSDTS